MLADLTTRTARETISLKCVLGKDHTTSITLATNEPTEVITGTGVGESTRDRVPIAIFRRQAKSTTFVWAISLDGETVKLDLLPTPADSSAVAVRVQSASGPIELLANPLERRVNDTWQTEAPFVVRLPAEAHSNPPK